MTRAQVALHLFESPVVTESRFLKLSGTLLASERITEVEVLGRWRPGLARVEQIDSRRRVRRTRLITDSSIVQRIRILAPRLGKILTAIGIAERQLRALLRILVVRPRLVLAHNPELLPVAVLGARLTRARVFYNPHELEEGRAGVRYPGVVRWVESRFARRADAMIVVSPRIAQWYAAAYPGLHPLVVRNVPRNPRLGLPLQRREPLRSRFRVPDDALLFIYQGLIDEFRDVPALIRCFSGDVRHHLVFMGFGDGVPLVLAAAKNCGRIHYLPPVAMDEIVAHSAGADVGLLLAPEGSSLSYSLTTANKLFEYAIAEVPIILTSNYSYMADLVREHRLGWVIEPTQEALESQVRSLDRDAVARVAAGFGAYSQTIDWDAEADVLRECVRSLLPAVDAGANS